YQIGAHKLDISRGPESTAPALRKHFEELLTRYSRVHVVSLLSQKDGSGEYTLGEAYRYHVSRLKDLKTLIGYTTFDFNAIVKGGGYERVGDLIKGIKSNLDGHQYLLIDVQSASANNNGIGEPVLMQQGVVRTNCLDCLDRTNVVQTEIARHVVLSYLESAGLGAYRHDETFLAAFGMLWADTGDWLSKIYAGTGALKSSYTRKGKSTVLGLLDDAAKSVNRFYINNFQDKARQEAIDLLLGKIVPRNVVLLRNPLHDIVTNEMDKRCGGLMRERLSIFVGTFNVNGKVPVNERLETWLCSPRAHSPDIYVIGIQELIELTAGQIVSADTDKLRALWEGALLKTLNNSRASMSDQKQKAQYVVLRSINLVALGLFVYVRSDNVHLVRNVEISSKKTGLGGMAGNKGGIGISLTIYDTSMIFITAHFAAGTSAVDDRNRDYWTILSGLNFRGKRVDDHDMVFWLGDFNYRINLPNDEVRARIEANQLEYLYLYDQLNDQRANGAVFDEYQEGPLVFQPTYKYDNGTSVYDT
ncbi:inositol polyphosphate 5-phosphatase, partial [Quaeritorhiza haematococci]